MTVVLLKVVPLLLVQRSGSVLGKILIGTIGTLIKLI